jgi:Ca-activated chloride channel homolog
MRRWFWLAFLFLGAWDPVTRKQADVAKGNERMAAGKPAEAEKHYQKALGEMPSNPGVLYDLGAAHFAAAQAMPPGPDRQKLLETAAQELRLAGDAPETALRANAHYNLGNTLFAEQKYKDAIEEYKKALRLEPHREDARHNLELALAKLPPPNPQQPPPQQQGSQDDQKKPQSGQSPEPSPSSSNDKKDQKPQDQQGQSQPKPEPQQSQAQPSQKDQPQNGQEQKGPEPKPSDKPNDKSDEKRDQPTSAGAEQAGDKDMDRKLDLLEDRSKDLQVQKAQERARERHRSGPVKDW